jgi:hypothetical protein
MLAPYSKYIFYNIPAPGTFPKHRIMRKMIIYQDQRITKWKNIHFTSGRYVPRHLRILYVEKSQTTTEKHFFLTFIYSFVPDLLVFHLQLGGGKGKSTTPKHSTPLLHTSTYIQRTSKITYSITFEACKSVFRIRIRILQAVAEFL